MSYGERTKTKTVGGGKKTVTKSRRTIGGGTKTVSKSKMGGNKSKTTTLFNKKGQKVWKREKSKTKTSTGAIHSTVWGKRLPVATSGKTKTITKY